MDFNTTLELIIKDLNEAAKIIDDFKSYQGVPELHVEFAKAKCKSSAEIIELLKKDKNLAPKPVKEDKKLAEEEIFTIEEEKISEKNDEVQFPEEFIKEVETELSAEKNIKPQQKLTSIFADYFTDMPTINKHFGNEGNVTEIIKSKPISSLRNAIGLNDRFLLIRELFGGDKDKYEQAIARLEECVSVDDAKAIISEYSNPDDENEALVLLLDLVKRKLNPNE